LMYSATKIRASSYVFHHNLNFDFYGLLLEKLNFLETIKTP